MLTDLIQHPVTFVKNEGLHIAQRQVLITDQSVQSTGSGDYDIRVCLLVRQSIDILLDWSASVEHSSLDIRKILAESSIFVLDLVGKFTGVAHHEDGAFSRNRFELVKRRQDEDSGLSETRLGLAENIDVEDCGRNADLLDCDEADGMLDLNSTQNVKKKTRRKVRPSPESPNMTGKSSTNKTLPPNW